MTHYICTGDCHGVSDEPKVCGAETCNKKGQPLEPCDCGDKESHEHVHHLKVSEEE